MKRRSSGSNPYEDAVKAGVLRQWPPTTDTGWRNYYGGREMVPAMTNYLPYPSFELGTTLATGWYHYGTVSGAVTNSLVQGRVGGYAQRIQYTSASDSNKRIVLQPQADPPGISGFSAGDPCTFSVYMKSNFLIYSVFVCNLMSNIFLSPYIVHSFRHLPV